MKTVIFTQSTMIGGERWAAGAVGTFPLGLADRLIAELVAIPYEPNKITHRDPL